MHYAPLDLLMSDMLTLHAEQTVDAKDTVCMRAAAKPRLFDADMIMATCSTHAECMHILCRSASRIRSQRVTNSRLQASLFQVSLYRFRQIQNAGKSSVQSLLCHASPQSLCAGTVRGSAVSLAISSICTATAAAERARGTSLEGQAAVGPFSAAHNTSLRFCCTQYWPEVLHCFPQQPCTFNLLIQCCEHTAVPYSHAGGLTD